MIKRALMLLTFFMVTTSSLVWASVPKYLNYQAALFDEGGNLLPDGRTRLYFRILDAAQKVVYEEAQDVEVVSGAVSVMIGNGVDPGSGAFTGGISADTLLPDGPRYLEVQAEGHSPEGPMELVSVPYAQYADVAFKVADGVVDSGQIKDGALKMSHFTDELVTELGSRIIGSGDQSTVVVRDEFNDYKNIISNSGGSAQVGVTPDFAYSSATNVQNVLKDLDLAIKKRYEDVEKVKESYTAQSNAEAAARSSADGALQGQITSHVSNASNPHGVTTEQIDAVSKSDLYGGEGGASGIIKDEKIPPNIARIGPSLAPEWIGSGGITYNNGWKFDAMNGAIECSGDLWNTSTVTCILERVEMGSGDKIAKIWNYEILPYFEVNAGSAEIEVKSIKRYINYAPDPTPHYYGIKVEMSIAKQGTEKAEGSYVRWKFYRRQIL